MKKTPDHNDSEQQDVRFINPPNHLKGKVGAGGLPKKTIEKGDNAIENTSIDILPYARQYLESLEYGLASIVKNPDEFSAIKDQAIEPIMQIKGNCGMFHYKLLSDIAAIALHFLETIEEWNDDAHAVMQAHIKTIQTIIKTNMKGSGGKEGYALAKELHNACQRYFAKHIGEE